MTRLTLLGLSCGLLLAACESGTVLEGDGSSDAREDAGGETLLDVTDLLPDPGADADADAGADADADADADVGPDVGECPPLMDGTWLSLEIEGPVLGDVDVETPCRMSLLVGGPPGTTGAELECGTGARMETYTITITANPVAYLSFWDGTDVTLRYVAERVWWINHWFTVRGPAGTLLFAGVSADEISPPGIDPSAWYDPLGVRVVSGVCPAEEDSCGPRERQALEVSYVGDTGLIYDGYNGYVGSLATVDVHVGGAAHYLSMECDDAPDQFYTVLFVLPPEG